MTNFFNGPNFKNEPSTMNSFDPTKGQLAAVGAALLAAKLTNYQFDSHSSISISDVSRAVTILLGAGAIECFSEMEPMLEQSEQNRQKSACREGVAMFYSLLGHTPLIEHDVCEVPDAA